jgi:UDPglucose 6-dehydrogenase
MKKIAIFGTGYVGLVSGVCLADLGNIVTCVDTNTQKLTDIKMGKIPFYEPGLSDLIEKNKDRLIFTSDADLAIQTSDIIFIAVGTPQNPDGTCDLRYIHDVAKTISQRINSYKLVVIKSTVPVGTSKLVEQIIKDQYKGEFDVVSNPEFLKEGDAIADFMHPDRIVIGSCSTSATDILESLYLPLASKIVVTDRESSELIKYASNAFLATKISFINTIAQLSEKVGANIDDIALGMGADKRIGPNFLKAGIGYGGSCFPKDIKALYQMGKSQNLDLDLIQMVDVVNNNQKEIPVRKLKDKINLKNAKIAVLGLSFKPNTDDLREAPSLLILQKLLDEGSQVWAWDPLSEENCQKLIPDVHYCPSPYEALEGADAAVIVTEWSELKELDFNKVKSLMKNPLIVDGRNVLDKTKALDSGIDYLGIGK